MVLWVALAHAQRVAEGSSSASVGNERARSARRGEAVLISGSFSWFRRFSLQNSGRGPNDAARTPTISNNFPRSVMQIISALLGGTIAALGGSSGINMYQSFRIAQNQHRQQPAPANSRTATGRQSPILEQYISSTDGKVCAPPNKSVDDVVSDLQRLRRSELIELWMNCEAPAQNMKSVDGDWNGVLLDNNGLLMTKISEFLTDALFGRNFDKWNGKAFRAGESGGINRFLPKSKAMTRATRKYNMSTNLIVGYKQANWMQAARHWCYNMPITKIDYHPGIL